MRILTIMSEEEEESIYDNADLSNSKEEEASTEPEIKPVVVPELEPEPEVEIISSVTEESGVEEAAKIKPKKRTKSTVMKIQRSLADTSKQIEKQTAQFNKISQNLYSLQKQFKLGQKQSEILIQIRSQINQIQRQISQVQKSIKRR
jgi:hypothetical protein